MLGKAAAGLAAPGLIGGAGTVVYHDNGGATVKIKNDKTGQAQAVYPSLGGSRVQIPPPPLHSEPSPGQLQLGDREDAFHP